MNRFIKDVKINRNKFKSEENKSINEIIWEVDLFGVFINFY